MSEELREFRSKSNKELLNELKKSYEDLRNLRFQAKMRELKDVSKIKKVKEKIARILTVLREKISEEINEKEPSGKSNK